MHFIIELLIIIVLITSSVVSAAPLVDYFGRVALILSQYNLVSAIHYSQKYAHNYQLSTSTKTDTNSLTLTHDSASKQIHLVELPRIISK